jgi:tetratricopeptide (TPR) repeat protein
VNGMLHLYGEGIRQAREALEISERNGYICSQGDSLVALAWLWHRDNQNDAAEEAAFRAIDLLPEKGQEYRTCQSHGALGSIYRSKGRREEAIHHFETALGTATSFNWEDELFSNHYSLAQLYLGEGDFDDTHAHIERAKSHAFNDRHSLGFAVLLQARAWLKQGRLENARSEALRALEIFQDLGVAVRVEECEGLLYTIEDRFAYDESTSNGKLTSDTTYIR